MSTKFVSTADIEKAHGRLTFGNMLKSFRVGEEITQVKLAVKLKCSKQSLNDIESGRKIPSIAKALWIAKKIGVLPELAVELVLQDQLKRENIRMTVKVTPQKNKVA
jgi:transcriptional regulator with XRE-family HTH domain